MMDFERVFHANINHLFAIKADPLQTILKSIVDELGQHKEMIEKLGSNGDMLIINTEDFYNEGL